MNTHPHSHRHGAAGSAGTAAPGRQHGSFPRHQHGSFPRHRHGSFPRHRHGSFPAVAIKLLVLVAAILSQPLPLLADHIDVTWSLADKDNLAASTMTAGGDTYITPAFALGSNIGNTQLQTAPNADAGYTAQPYSPTFTALVPKTRVTSKTAGHCITLTITPKSGHTFKPGSISFDAAKFGTDGGLFDVYVKNGSGAETAVATGEAPLRNKVTAGNPNGYSHHTYQLSDILVQSGSAFQLILYIYNLNGTDNENPKSIGFRGVTIGGETDEPIYDASHYFTAATCSAGNLMPLISALRNGATASWPTKLYGDPTGFSITAASGYTASVTYNNKVATLTARQGTTTVFSVSVRFTVSYVQPKPAAKPLNRGLMAVKVSGGVLVSWRWRKTDDPAATRFRLYRNGTLISNAATPDGTITTRTNWLDTSGNTSSTYKLEVLDGNGNVTETQDGVKPFSDQQVTYITLEGGAPTDPTTAGATYTPNDASFCDMDGDGEYEIILKWAPNNEKDAASSGTTSPAFYACYKLSGKRLWMLHTGHNMFNSAHTAMFIAWDLDGDGYGEFMVKTAPGAIDGEGNYVLMPGDSPTENLKSGRGKQDHGSEYITVFDGTTGAELCTTKYHTAYQDESTSFWGDSNQNRSERYLAAIAWLDGEQSNPSAIFARGYYNGCKIGAYDWDGTDITLRWLHRGESASKGTVRYDDGTVRQMNSSVYGEGCHWICVGDVTGDGRQEIHYGSGALKPDGTTLYRTGLGHGDAMHLSDFMPSHPGQELFMVHEEKSSNGNYGSDIRDAATGQILLRVTAGGDTGRGIMAHFNAEADDAYWQHSASADLFDTSGATIATNVSHGGGAGLSFRVYWNEDLADDFYGKNILEYWNPTSKGFWRMQINGGNYVYGNYNNSSKQNPCVSGDILGDWREEIVTWDQQGSNYRLVVNATNYETPYRLPHLMDDASYRAQLIGQNVCYNQPPHLSYDPIAAYTTTYTVPAAGWGVFYTPYPVRVPQGITAYQVTGVNRTTRVLNMSAIAAGATLPAGASIVVKGTAGQTVSFRPSTMTPVAVNSTYLKGDIATQKLTATAANVHFYQLQPYPDTDIVCFNPVEAGTVQLAATPWLQVSGTPPTRDRYYLQAGDIPTGITATDDALPADDVIYDLSGRRVAAATARGIYILGGHKVVK
ncbi:MAG: hypothetical protein IJS59_06525 [Bacteroidaceae bacterium]|nr:hypothetical protein [Bacteroidaceae bacterium]